MTAYPTALPLYQFFDSNGDPLVGGKLYTYYAGTTTPLATYTDSTGSIENTNPIILDASGQCTIWFGDNSYKLNLTDSNNVQQDNWPLDNVQSETFAKSLAANLLDGSNVALGDALIAVKQPFTASTATTQHEWNSRIISIKDFGAVGDGTTDDTAAIQAAIDYCAMFATLTKRAVILVPQGTYTHTAIVLKSYMTLRGMGGCLKLKNGTVTSRDWTGYPIGNVGYTHSIFENLMVDGNSANQVFDQTGTGVADALTVTGANSSAINCHISNAVDSGIMFSDAPGGRISGCRISGGTDLGVYVNYSSEVSPAHGDMLVQNNVIDGFPFGGIGVKRSVENVIVSGNDIFNCGNGITVEDFSPGAGGAPDNIMIVGNNMRDIGYPKRGTNVSERGISISAATNVVCVGNKVLRCSGTGLSLDGCSNSVFQGNHFTGYTTSPFSSGNYGMVTIDRNDSGTWFYATKNLIEGNHFTGFNGYAAYIQNLTLSSVVGNRFESPTGAAFRINATADTNIIVGNHIQGNASDVQYYAGTVSNCYHSNRLYNGASEWEKQGFSKSISLASPVGNIVPLFAGQILMTTPGATRIWQATGSTNADWVQLG